MFEETLRQAQGERDQEKAFYMCEKESYKKEAHALKRMPLFICKINY
jgi:hypothetical protein